MLPASQRQHLTTVDGVAGYWASRTGGEVTAETSEVWDGGALRPSQLSAPASTDNIVVGRPYYPDKHQRARRDLSRRVGRLRTTITVQDTDADLVPIGTPDVYPGALLVRCTPPEGDASSSDAGMWEMEFAVTGLA